MVELSTGIVLTPKNSKTTLAEGKKMSKLFRPNLSAPEADKYAAFASS